MQKETIFALIYAAIAAAWQYALWSYFPNVGMGGLGVVYVVWPVLIASAIGLYFLLKKVGKAQVVTFLFACIAMMVVTGVLHPKDRPIEVGAIVEADAPHRLPVIHRDSLTQDHPQA